VVSWVALAVVLLAAAVRPPLRHPLLAVLAAGYLLVLWFFLARTKTLSWTSVSLMFALGLPWAVGSGLGLRAFGHPGGLGANTVLAGVGEAGLVLVPVLVLALVVPGRVRTFSAADWLLAGLTAGLSFQAAQALLDEVARPAAAHYGLSPLAGGSATTGARFAGLGVVTAAVTTTAGLALAAWRHSRRPVVGPAGRAAWRGLAVLAPVVLWWLAASAQTGFDAVTTHVPGLLTGSGGTAPALPWLLRAGWRVSLHGALFGGLFVLLWVLALLVDGGRLRNAADEAEDPLPQPFPPARRADAWAGRLTGWAGTSSALPVAVVVWLVAAGCAAVAYIARDVAVVVAGFRPAGQPTAKAADAGTAPKARARVRTPKRESRGTALARGRAAAVLVRAVRADAMAVSAGPDSRLLRRTTRLTAGFALVVVLATALGLAPHWAGRLDRAVPSLPGGAPLWTGGAITRFDAWFATQSGWEVLLAGLALLAVLVLAAGPLDLSLGSLTNSPFLTGHAADDPAAGRDALTRIRAYLATRTPAEAIADGAGALAGFLPGGLVKPAAAKEIRAAADEFAFAPAKFVGSRRAAARRAAQFPSAADVTAPIRIRTNPDLPAIKLADGRLVPPMTDPNERLFIATMDDLIRGNIRVHNEAADYQVRIYGDDERLVSQRPEKWSDGQNTAYGMVCEAVWFDGAGASWYAPETLPEAIRHKAYLEIDRRLLEYAAVVYYPANPFLGLEITTNNPQVAQVLRGRMERLAIPGYVVLEP
jgi:hypothetical protein